MTIGRVLILIAVIVFVLAAFSVDVGKFNLVAIGLAFFAAAGLV